MTKNEFLRMIEKISESDPDSLEGAESLDSLDNWDSLCVLALISQLDKRLKISLPAEKIYGCKTVNDLMGLVSGSLTE